MGVVSHYVCTVMHICIHIYVDNLIIFFFSIELKVVRLIISKVNYKFDSDLYFTSDVTTSLYRNYTNLYVSWESRYK